MDRLAKKILSPEDFIKASGKLRAKGRKVVFTNGCFDILHSGHVRYLQAARELGDFLFIGVNSDQSVQQLKGPNRPIVPLANRMIVLAGLSSSSYITSYDTKTPAELITATKPAVLVKGGDWAPDQIVGANQTIAAGGEVKALYYHQQNSTSQIIDRIIKLYAPPQD